MRRAIFIFLSLLVALSMAAIPADTISARPASTPQLSPPSPAQQLSEDELIEEIYDELDGARALTSDRAIKNQIAGLKKAVEAVEKLMRSGDKEGALNLKYAIAERLEIFINQLPVASPSLTNLAAAAPAANPLYDEMVNIRGKIGMLIDLEEREIPQEKRPPPPTIERPPEMEKLIVYSAKFLCGPALGKEGVQPGSYSTAINIHNPNNGTVYLYKKAVIAKREDEPRGKISDFHRVILQADEAIEVDCIDIISLLGHEQEVELTAPSQQTQTILQTTAVSPVSSLIRFIKGFVVIYSTAPLDVVAVYTASTSVGFGLDVEYLSPSRVSTITYTPPPEEEAECPTGCACRTEAEAKEQGLVLCQGQRIVCAYDDNQRPSKYCFEKPTEEAECPTGCVCSTKAAAIERDYTTLCQDAPCGRDDQQNLMYCWKPTEEAECPTGCVCLYKEDAYKRYGQNATLCQDEPCGRDDQQNLMYCWKPTAEGKPSMTLTPAYAENTVGDHHKVIATVKDGNGNPVRGAQVLFHFLETGSTPASRTDTNGQAVVEYSSPKQRKDTIVASVTVNGYNLEAQATKVWTSKATEEVECPQGCACRTEAEAKRLGLTWCQGQKIVCAYDENQRPTKYCFQKPTEEAEPARITLTPTQARNKVCTYHKVVATVYDASGNRLVGQKVYFHVDGANTGAGSPPGADFEATTDANGQAVFSYHGENPGEDKITAMAGSAGPVTGAFKTWYTEPTEQPRAGKMSISPVQARNAVGNKHTITVIVYDTNGNPMPNVRVRISHTGAHNFAPIELTTDANGKTSYSYTGKNTGTDTIVATVDNLSAKATKEWYSLTTTPPTQTIPPATHR